MRRDRKDVVEYRGVAPLPLPFPELLALLTPLATDARLARMRAVAAQRVRSVIPVLEGLSDPHNGAAILRSCDAFGCQEVHTIDGRFPFAISEHVSRKTEQWLETRHFPSIEDSTSDLRARGFEIFYADMDGQYAPEDFAPNQKIALLFGNEHKGPSPEARKIANGSFRIPMNGFVESLNVSVAAAITFYTVLRPRHGELTAEAQDEIVARFLWQTVPNAQEVVEKALGLTSPS